MSWFGKDYTVHAQVLETEDKVSALKEFLEKDKKVLENEIDEVKKSLEALEDLEGELEQIEEDDSIEGHVPSIQRAIRRIDAGIAKLDEETEELKTDEAAERVTSRELRNLVGTLVTFKES